MPPVIDRIHHCWDYDCAQKVPYQVYVTIIIPCIKKNPVRRDECFP